MVAYGVHPMLNIVFQVQSSRTQGRRSSGERTKLWRQMQRYSRHQQTSAHTLPIFRNSQGSSQMAIICVEAASRMIFPVAKGTMCIWRIGPTQLARSRKTTWHIWRSEDNATTGSSIHPAVFSLSGTCHRRREVWVAVSRFVFELLWCTWTVHMVLGRSSHGVWISIFQYRNVA